MMRRKYRRFATSFMLRGNIRAVAAVGLKGFLAPISAGLGKPLAGPILGTLVATYRCNLNCRMCPSHHADNASGPDEFDTGRMKSLLNGMAGLGVRALGFTGGEPLLREDIFELIDVAVRRRLVTHLNTNGLLLGEEQAKNLLATGIHSINISLDGASPRVHDRIRGREGAGEATAAGVRELVARRNRMKHRSIIQLVMLVSEMNFREIPSVLDLAVRIGVDGVGFIPEHEFPSAGRKEMSHEFLQILRDLPSLKKSVPFIDNSAEYLGLFPGHFSGMVSAAACLAGYNSITADCFGNVFPCVPWSMDREPIGNVSEDTLASIWRSASYREVRREMQLCSGCAWNCHKELDLLCRKLLPIG